MDILRNISATIAKISSEGVEKICSALPVNPVI
jgi:hypothetical protein